MQCRILYNECIVRAKWGPEDILHCQCTEKKDAYCHVAPTKYSQRATVLLDRNTHWLATFSGGLSHDDAESSCLWAL